MMHQDPRIDFVWLTAMVGRNPDTVAEMLEEFAGSASRDAAALRATDLLDGSSCLKPYSGDPARPLGISIGIAVYDPAASEDLESLMGRADTAMYQVKHNGKAGYIIAPGAGDHGNSEIQAITA